MGVGLWPETEEALVPSDAFEDSSHIEAHESYQTDPIGWARDILGIPEHTLRWSLNEGYPGYQWDGTPDPIACLFEAVADWQDVGVESGTGTGKSFGCGVLILWFLACFPNSRVFTFAPKEEQLRLYIWMEMGKLWQRFQQHFPSARLTDLRIRMKGGTDDSWGAVGYAVGIVADEEIATKAAGMHAEHLLLVYEETPGIPPAVMLAGENTCTAPHNLRIAVGNPNHRLDALHKFATSPGVTHITMSALDHPNVVSGNASLIPGAISRTSIEKRRIKYTEASPVYQSRVRGISPAQASDALIRLDWLEAAAQRYDARRVLDQLPARVTGKGVDVANSEHGDKACIVDFADNVCIRIDAFQCPDANKLGAQVAREINTSNLSPLRVGVDTIGVGAGTVNELRRLGKVVQALNASSAPVILAEKVADGNTHEWERDTNKFRNLRSQMYWQAREDLRLGSIDVPKDEELWEELVAPTFVDEPMTIVEPKEDIKDRLGRSPDKADAFVMANWVRARVIVISEKKSQPENRTPGFDFKSHKPKERETGDQVMEKLFQQARPAVTHGRYRTPRR